jgi:hypothetical protein
MLHFISRTRMEQVRCPSQFPGPGWYRLSVLFHDWNVFIIYLITRIEPDPISRIGYVISKIRLNILHVLFVRLDWNGLSVLFPGFEWNRLFICPTYFQN